MSVCKVIRDIRTKRALLMQSLHELPLLPFSVKLSGLNNHSKHDLFSGIFSCMIESNRGCDFGYKPLIINNLRFRQVNHSGTDPV